MSVPTAVGTIVQGMTTRQTLAVIDAALAIAEEAGIAVPQVNMSALGHGHATLLPEPGDTPALAFELGLTSRRTQPYGDAETIEVFEGPWCGIQITVLHTIPASVPVSA